MDLGSKTIKIEPHDDEQVVFALCHFEPSKQAMDMAIPILSVSSPLGNYEYLRTKLHQDVDILIDAIKEVRNESRN